MESFWSHLQKTGTFVPAILDIDRKKGKMKRRKKRERKKKWICVFEFVILFLITLVNKG